MTTTIVYTVRHQRQLAVPLYIRISLIDIIIIIIICTVPHHLHIIHLALDCFGRGSNIPPTWGSTRTFLGVCSCWLRRSCCSICVHRRVSTHRFVCVHAWSCRVCRVRLSICSTWWSLWHTLLLIRARKQCDGRHTMLRRTRLRSACGRISACFFSWGVTAIGKLGNRSFLPCFGCGVRFGYICDSIWHRHADVIATIRIQIQRRWPCCHRS